MPCIKSSPCVRDRKKAREGANDYRDAARRDAFRPGEICRLFIYGAGEECARNLRYRGNYVQRAGQAARAGGWERVGGRNFARAESR